MSRRFPPRPDQPPPPSAGRVTGIGVGMEQLGQADTAPTRASDKRSILDHGLGQAVELRGPRREPREGARGRVKLR